MNEQIDSSILQQYEIKQKMGKGAYGIVWKAVEKSSKKIVALKKIFEAFHNSTDAQRTYREALVLYQLQKHENIIKLLKIIKAENNWDLYMIFDFMETDLHAVIVANLLKPVHKQYIIYQLLKGLKYIHSGEIVHWDLKPSNLLVNSDCLIKIADFGLAWSVNQTQDSDPIMTEFVATRWYRAPEIVLGSQRYTKAVDMWSIGCILAELVNRQPLFPGKASHNQIQIIFEVIGKPSQKDILSIESESASQIIRSIQLQNQQSFESHFQDQDPFLLDFLKKCLQFSPLKRLTVDDALRHPYVQRFHQEKQELFLSKPINLKINDNKKLTVDQYRELIYKFIDKYYPKKDIKENFIKQKVFWQINFIQKKENIFPCKKREQSKENNSKWSQTGNIMRTTCDTLKPIKKRSVSKKKIIEFKKSKSLQSSIETALSKKPVFIQKNYHQYFIQGKTTSLSKVQNYYQKHCVVNKY